MEVREIIESDAERQDRAERAGFSLRLYHATRSAEDFSAFAPFSHFGTPAQANMRGGEGRGASRIIPVLVRLRRVKRLTDKNNGQWPAAKLRQLARQGYDGVVYLNRYEGIPHAEFEAVRQKGIDPDRIADSEFKRRIPSAADSYIVFDPKNVRSVNARFDAHYTDDMLA